MLSRVALLWVLGLSSLAQAQAPRVVVDGVEAQVLTAHGPFEVHRLQFDEGRDSFQLVLNGKVIGTETRYEAVSLSIRLPDKGPARFVLLELTTGGSGCLAFFKLIEIADDGRAIQSKEFGNCGNRARMSFTRGELRVDVLKAGGAPAQSWRYKDGRLSKASR